MTRIILIPFTFPVFEFDKSIVKIFEKIAPELFFNLKLLFLGSNLLYEKLLEGKIEDAWIELERIIKILLDIIDSVSREIPEPSRTFIKLFTYRTIAKLLDLKKSKLSSSELLIQISGNLARLIEQIFKELELLYKLKSR